MAENLNGVVNRILAAPAPVLCLDTCALLDIIRVPIRFRQDKISVNVITAAFDLISKASTERLWVLILISVNQDNQLNQRSIFPHCLWQDYRYF